MKKNQKGISLIELLVVIAIFAFVGILVTQSIILTLQGTKKSTSLINARENLSYSLSIIERQIRGADSITSDCAGVAATSISYLDQNGASGAFSCEGTLGLSGSYIASGSGSLKTSLTGDSVKISVCSFICSASTNANPPVVSVNLTVQDAGAVGAAGGSVSSSTQIYLRNY